MAPFEGFPDKSEFTPVPNLLFGQVLEEIDDPLALKCFLRVLWLHSQKKGIRSVLTREELLSDRTLARVVSTHREARQRLRWSRAGQDCAVLGCCCISRSRQIADCSMYMCPTPREGEAAVQSLKDSRPDLEITDGHMAAPEAAPKPNIFKLYEANIGIMNPLIAEELKDAELQYPEAWVEEAFREAVTGNKRSWRYIAAILKRWKTEGKDDGESWGHPKKIDSREWIRRHGLPGSSR